jgi:polysaccharide export outer membrane protein
MLKTFSALVTASILLLTIPSSAWAQSDMQQEPAKAAADQTGVYIIGNGDILEIVTWKEPDFSREEIIVRLDGKISFPLLDDLTAAGKTPTQLKWDIENQLKDFVTDPNVTVSVTSGASKRFYILGEVVNTGEYPLVKNLTVLQAFAVAGGFTEWASKKEIILFRREGGKETVIRIDYRQIMKGKDFSQNVEIRADDTIIVP